MAILLSKLLQALNMSSSFSIEQRKELYVLAKHLLDIETQKGKPKPTDFTKRKFRPGVKCTFCGRFTIYEKSGKDICASCGQVDIIEQPKHKGGWGHGHGPIWGEDDDDDGSMGWLNP